MPLSLAAAISPYARAVLPMMLRYLPGGSFAGGDLVLRVDRFDRFAVVVAGLERCGVRFGDLGLACRTSASMNRSVGSSARSYSQKTRPIAKKLRQRSASFCAEPKPFDREPRELGHRRPRACWYVAEAAVFERVGLVAGLLEALLVEGVFVDDQHAAVAQVAEVRRQRGRVHRHERVDRVAGRVDVVCCEKWT